MAVLLVLQIAPPGWDQCLTKAVEHRHERDAGLLFASLPLAPPAKPLYDLSTALKPARKMRRGTADYSQSLRTWPSYSLM